MAVVYLSPIGNSVIPFLNANGAPNANGFLSSFLAGTSTPSATYTTSAGSVQNAVSIPLGPDGRVPNEVWLVSGTSYKFVLLDSTLAVVPGSTYDNISGINDPAAFGAGTVSSLTISGALTGNTASFSGAFSALSAAITNAITAGSAAITGALSAAAATFTGLLDISGAAAGQIKFPAAQNASANVNTLDDYEEGSWTPVLAFGGASVGITYALQVGTYTKIGNLVTLFFRITLTSKGSSTGNATITGLPFTSLSSGITGYIGSVGWGSMTTSYVLIAPFLGANAASFTFLGATAATAGLTAVQETGFSLASDVYGTISYRV